MMPRMQPIPNLPLPNPFLLRIQLVEKETMRQHMIYHFGEDFATSVLGSGVPIVYPIAMYGQDWTCSILILY